METISRNGKWLSDLVIYLNSLFDDGMLKPFHNTGYPGESVATYVLECRNSNRSGKWCWKIISIKTM